MRRGPARPWMKLAVFKKFLGLLVAAGAGFTSASPVLSGQRGVHVGQNRPAVAASGWTTRAAGGAETFWRPRQLSHRDVAKSSRLHPNINGARLGPPLLHNVHVGGATVHP